MLILFFKDKRLIISSLVFMLKYFLKISKNVYKRAIYFRKESVFDFPSPAHISSLEMERERPRKNNVWVHFVDLITPQPQLSLRASSRLGPVLSDLYSLSFFILYHSPVTYSSCYCSHFTDEKLKPWEVKEFTQVYPVVRSWNFKSV